MKPNRVRANAQNYLASTIPFSHIHLREAKLEKKTFYDALAAYPSPYRTQQENVQNQAIQHDDQEERVADMQSSSAKKASTPTDRPCFSFLDTFMITFFMKAAI